MDHKGEASKNDYEPRCFEQTLAEELAQIWKRRKKFGHYKGGAAPNISADKAEIIDKAHKARLLGLAFSGGGIRSATFNLGILQALADMRILNHVDYLSTVSGGGYIGSWFAAWVRRQDEECRRQQQKSTAASTASTSKADREESHCNGFRSVVDELKPEVGTDPLDRDPGALQPDPAPIRHLREYSNYLTPRRGLWSTDAWTLGVTYLRNLLLTLSVLLGTVFSLVLLTGAVASGIFQLASMEASKLNLGFLQMSSENIDPVSLFVVLLFCACLFTASFILGMELIAAPSGPAAEYNKPVLTSPLNWAAVATLFAAVFGLLWLWRNQALFTEWNLDVLWASATIVLTAFVGGLLGRRAAARRGCARSEGRCLPIFVAGLMSLLVLTALLYLLGHWMTDWTQAGSGAATWQNWHAVVWGAPLVTLVFALSAAVFVGLSGRALTELDRELLARYFGVIAKWMVLLTALLLFVVYAYPLVSWVNANMASMAELNAVTEMAARKAAEMAVEIAKTAETAEEMIRAADLAKAAEATDAARSYLTAGHLWGTLTAVWGALSAVGAWLAGAGKGDGGGLSGWLKRSVIAFAPYVFIIGLFVFAVWAAHALLDLAISHWSWLAPLVPQTDSDIPYLRYWSRMQAGYWALLLPVSAVVALLTLIWSRRIGVNTFSLHAMYGNRLVRAYLGASNLERRAHPFHGFDEQDNAVHMKDLVADCYSGPLPIVNTAINLVSSRRLAWQQRKAASFTFTPLYAGYEFYGEEDPENKSGWPSRTGGYVASRVYGGRNGVSLGRALTISGAAASPNMGYHSSPGLTFLMTTFNVRLGWWLPNPGKRPQGNHPNHTSSWLSRKLLEWNKWRLQSDGPRLGLVYLLMELFGKTSARSSYVYLSDGGHFENLGIYELVRRRCRFIIACDAEADPKMEFSGLGNAVEKCRTDLGVPIRIDVSQLRPEASSGLSPWHCAVGCIRYSEADPKQPDGTILYIKASRTGGEPQDVQTYATQHAGFPHETTADQWFDESQFESYRALGEHSAWKALGTPVRVARHSGAEDKGRMKERMFLELRKQWYPHFSGEQPQPADHDAELQALVDTMREDSQLAFLDGQLYPNLYRIAEAHRDEDLIHERARPRHPTSYDELRAGFFFCKRLFQFMQQVFHDQRLDTEYAAPSNRGWMNLFRRWSWSRMFRFTWTMTAGTYSARFQSFCENQLGLESGDPDLSQEPMHLRARIENLGEQPMIEVLAGPGGKVVDWQEGNKAVDLEAYEHRLIEEFIDAYAREEKFVALWPAALDFEVYALRVETENPYAEQEQAATLGAGFLIVGPTTKDPKGKPAVLYFRIRSSMRNMDLARKAFLSMKSHPRLKEIHPAIVEDLPNVAESNRDPLGRRAHHEVHVMERQDIHRCRWFSQLLDDLEEETPQARSAHSDTEEGDCRLPE